MSIPSSANSETYAEPVRLADAPFDNDSQADVILISSDGTHFRVFRKFLSLASPIFADMFSLGEASPNELLDGIPVVHMVEDAETLDLLLRWCYHLIRTPPLGTSLDRTWRLSAAMQKYSIDAFVDAVDDALRVHLASDPIGALAVAVMLGLEDVKREALRAALAIPLEEVAAAERPGLTDKMLNTLVRYHIACGAAASKVVRSRAFYPSRTIRSGTVALMGWIPPECCTCAVVDIQDEYGWSAPRFVWKFLDTARSAFLLRPGMCAEDVASMCTMVLCSKCCGEVYAHIKDTQVLMDLVMLEVNIAIAKVPVPKFV